MAPRRLPQIANGNGSGDQSTAPKLARDALLVILTVLIVLDFNVHLYSPVQPLAVWKSKPRSHNVRPSIKMHRSLMKAGDGEGYAPPESAGPYSHVLAALLEKHTAMQAQVTAGRVPMRRALIAQCHPGQVCAGLGDRIFGILTLYLGAVLSDRVFFIDHTKPEPLSHLQPNFAQWRLEDVKDVPLRTGLENCVRGMPQYDDCSFYQKLLPDHQCGDVLNAVFSDQPVLVVNSNHRTDCIEKLLVRNNILPPLAGGKVLGKVPAELRMWAANVSHMLFHHLFRFSPDVERAASRAFPLLRRGSRIFDCTVCLHIRSGTGLDESVRYGNYRDFAKCGLKAEHQTIVSQKACAQDQVKWLVVSDNADAARLLAKHVSKVSMFNTSSLGRPAHVERLAANNNGALLHIFVDWYLLTQCRTLVASLSTFSGTAAIVQGGAMRRYDVEVAARGGVCQQRNFYDYQRDANG